MTQSRSQRQKLIELDPPLVPRNGRKLIVVGVARGSTSKQDEDSLTDQRALIRARLVARIDMPYELIMITFQGSGELLV